MTLVERPLNPRDFPNEHVYLLNVWEIVKEDGLDPDHLFIYRRAVEAGFYTDQLPPEEG